MLDIEIENKPKLNKADLDVMSLYDTIRDERVIKISVNGKIFFAEPLFPILELVHYCTEWIKNPNQPFVYISIESEENPILSFTPQKKNWKIYSVWQKFECNDFLSHEEVVAFVWKIIHQVLQ